MLAMTRRLEVCQMRQDRIHYSYLNASAMAFVVELLEYYHTGVER